MEDDGPPRDWLGEISEMLVNGGYFRARMTSISAFDKIIGALAWSITASAAEVTFDLFFDEDANLGQKIQLSENIEKSLVMMKCPHPLQAHQIQGLDYPAVFPVVRWLVKKVIATREEFGDKLRRFATYSYRKGYEYDSLVEAKPDIEGVANARPSYRVQRKLRPKQGTPLPHDRLAHVRMVLVEYGHSASQLAGPMGLERKEGSASPLATKLKGMGLEAGGSTPEASSREHGLRKAQMEAAAASMAEVGDEADVSGRKAANILGLRSDENRAAFLKYNQDMVEAEGLATRASNLEKQKASAQRQVAAEHERLAQQRSVAAEAVGAAEAAEQELHHQQTHNQRCVAELDRLSNRLGTPEERDTAKRLLALIKKVAALKKDESEFKAKCRAEMARLQAELAGDARPQGLTPAEEARVAEVEAAHAADQAKWEAMRASLAKRTRAVALISGKLDEMPARPELMQYEKRFVELYEQVTAKLEETRRYYDVFNTLQETKKLLQKEISLLNSIESQFDTAMSNYDGKSKFVFSVKGINDGLHANIAKADGKLKAEEKELQLLSDEHNASVVRQRQYFNFVKEFQEECARGDKLRAALKG